MNVARKEAHRSRATYFRYPCPIIMMPAYRPSQMSEAVHQSLQEEITSILSSRHLEQEPNKSRRFRSSVDNGWAAYPDIRVMAIQEPGIITSRNKSYVVQELDINTSTALVYKSRNPIIQAQVVCIFELLLYPALYSWFSLQYHPQRLLLTLLRRSAPHP